MNASHLAWPEDRRLFRRSRRPGRFTTALALVLAAASIVILF